MSRNLKGEVIVLKSTRLQEFHKLVHLLSPTIGVIQAIAHGAYKGKGKLGATTELFTCSTAYLYYDPVKKSYKITEMEPLSFFDSIRTDLTRFYTASLMAEVVLKSYGGGEGYDQVYRLLKDSLTVLDSAAPPERVEIQYLWRLVGLLGFRPNTESCSSCGRSFPGGARYRRGGEELLCEECAESLSEGIEEESVALSAGSLRYLAHTEALSLRESAAIGLERRSELDLLAFLHGLIQEIVEAPLLSLQAGPASLGKGAPRRSRMEGRPAQTPPRVRTEASGTRGEPEGGPSPE